MNIEKPQARSLIVCDYLVVEEGSRNVSLVNCFCRKNFEQFPSRPIDLAVYCPLSNGFGQFPMTLRIERLSTLQLIYEHRSTPMFLDRLAEVRYYVKIKGLRFPAPGSYGASLRIEHDVLAETRFEVGKVEG